MTTIVTRAGKGSPLTNTELDANFTNLKTTADAALPLSGGSLTGGLSGTTASFSGAVTSTGLTVNAAQSNFNDSAGSVIVFQKSASAKAWIANRSFGFHDGNGLAINTTDANPIRFGTNNTEGMRLTSTGLGIGTQVPQRLLHINGTEGVARFTSTASGNSGLEVGVGTNSQAFMWHTENAHCRMGNSVPSGAATTP